MSKIKVFFRIDDVDRESIDLSHLLNLFVKTKIPANLGIVPKKLNKDFANYLTKLNSSNLFEIDEHGFEHKRNNKGELDIDDRELSRKLEQGREIMNKYFLKNFSGILTVPWHTHTSSLFKIAKICGFRAVSVNDRSDRLATIFYRIGDLFKKNILLGHHVSHNFSFIEGIFEISPSIDVAASYRNEYGGEDRLKDKALIIKEFNHLAKSQDQIGFMLHPSHFNSKSDLNALRYLLNYLKQRKNISFKKMSEIVNDCSLVSEQAMERYYNINPYYFKHLREKHWEGYFFHIFRFLSFIPKKDLQKMKILEVGSGSGNLLELLVKRYNLDPENLVGVDLSLIGLKKHKYGIKVKANAKHLPFVDEFFDLVICTDTLEHVIDYEASLEEMYRVASPSGYILIRTQNFDCPLLSFDGNDLNIYKKIIADKDAVSKTSAKIIKNFFQTQDGKVIKFETWASFNWKIPALRIFNYLPILNLLGGTCTVLFRKDKATKEFQGDVTFACPNCKKKIKDKPGKFSCKSCNLYFTLGSGIYDFYLKK